MFVTGAFPYSWILHDPGMQFLLITQAKRRNSNLKCALVPPRCAFCSSFRFRAVAEGYLAGDYRAGNIEDDDAYLADEYEGEDGYEDSSSNSDSQPKVRCTHIYLLYFSFPLTGSQGSISFERFLEFFLRNQRYYICGFTNIIIFFCLFNVAAQENTVFILVKQFSILFPETSTVPWSSSGLGWENFVVLRLHIFGIL